MANLLKFNPGFQADDEAVANFVVRQDELVNVTCAFASHPSGGFDGRPRVLVTAPRGAGKTTLCRRVLAETRLGFELQAQWHAVFLSEESYTVTTPGEFFLECLFQLADQTDDSALRGAHAVAAKMESEVDLFTAAVGQLRAYSERINKRLLIIVENFHVILNQQIGDTPGSGQVELLDALDDDSLFGVLATSVAPNLSSEEDSIRDYRLIHLKPLSLEECHTLWQSLTKNEVAREKIRPLQILTGGSPRLLLILSEFMKTPSLRHLMENLSRLIDQNTEYFKSQLDALPATERKVFVSLLDAWDPSTAKTIADASRVSTNIASTMLGRLVDRGAVIKEFGVGRTAIYQASERLFNIYYLMRRRSHPSNRVRALVTFMMDYYDQDELIQTTSTIVREACTIEPARRADYHSAFSAIMARASEAARNEILALTPQEFIGPYRESQASSRARAAAKKEVQSSPDKETASALLQNIEKAADEDNFGMALKLLKSAIKKFPLMAELQQRLSLLYLRMDMTDKAVKASKRAVALGPEDPWSYAISGMALSTASLDGDAEAHLAKALELDSNNIMALSGLAEIHDCRNEFPEARRLYERISANGRMPDIIRARYGSLLERIGEKDAAEAVLRENESPYDYRSRRKLAELLLRDGRGEAGIQVLLAAAQETNDAGGWADLGLYQLRLKEFRAAKETLQRAIKTGAYSAQIYSALHTAMNGLGEFDTIGELAEEWKAKADNTTESLVTLGELYAGAGRVDEAERVFREAMAKPGGELALFSLAEHLKSQPARRSEVESLLRNALDDDRFEDICAIWHALARNLSHAGRDDAAAEILARARECHTECICCCILQAEISLRNEDRKGARMHFERAAELDPTNVNVLTGMASLAENRSERERLIALAIEAHPNHPRGYFAKACSRAANDLKGKASDILRALQIDPRFTPARLLLAESEARSGRASEAMKELEEALGDTADRRDLVPMFVTTAMTIASLGLSADVSELLERHEFGEHLEPLVVALQLMRGEKPLRAKEIMEVAEDIIKRSAKDTISAIALPKA